LTGPSAAALEVLERQFGIPIPASDFLLSNPYTAMISGATASDYYGLQTVAGMKCHHIAIRTVLVDWQLWVRAEGDPLPMKHVITTRDVVGAP